MNRLILALFMLLAACSPSNMSELLAKHTPPALAQQAKADIASLRPEGKPVPEPLQQVGLHTNQVLGKEQNTWIAFEGGPDDKGQFLLIELQYSEVAGKFLLNGSKFERRNHSALAIPPFNLLDGSLAGMATAVLGILAFITSIAAAVIAARIPRLHRKWLWVIGCLISFGNFVAGWTSGAVGFQLGIKLLGFSALAAAGTAEWTVGFGIPIIALLFLYLRAKGKLRIKIGDPQVAG